MKKKILVFPCGSVPAIEINTALRNSLRVELYGASSVEDHGKFIYKNYIGGLPNISEDNFINEINKVLFENRIDFIIPTHDTIALFLIENEKLLNAEVIASNLETTKMCRYKSLTYERFKGQEFIPKIYNINQVIEFPVFLKPDCGQGGQGSHIAYDIRDLEFYLNKDSNLIISEYLPGEEITVDCFTDRKSRLRFLGPRTRTRTMAGISVKSKTIPVSNEIRKIANKLNEELQFRGYWFFQIKKDKYGKYKLLEISTRLAGTASANMNLDINFPLLSILDFSNEEVEILPNSYEIKLDRTFINRYELNIEYKRVYIDFDDTLILNNKYYNEYLMMFMYQCINKNKQLVLITKHEKNIKESLQKFKIPFEIFDEIIEVKPNDHKYKHINNTDSIFIDNSFLERKLVRENLGIPSFDVSNIECLIDWRG